MARLDSAVTVVTGAGGGVGRQAALRLAGGGLWHFMETSEEMLHPADAVMEGIEHGWLTPRISRVLPLADAAEAHRLLEDRKTIGKILLATGD